LKKAPERGATFRLQGDRAPGIHFFCRKSHKMSRDDDTFLSAYLDGQLDADQQLLVDSALVSSPELAERLRGLAVVRDLVVGLHRDSRIDVTAVVMNRIRPRRRSLSLFSPLRPGARQARRAAAVAGILTAAAGILLVVTVTAYWQARVHRFRPPARASLDNVIVARTTAINPTGLTESDPAVTLEPRSSSSGAGSTSRVALETRQSAPERDGKVALVDGEPGPVDQGISRRLLDGPYRRRLFRIKNGRDDKAQQQVAGVVERTTRFGFLKISVPKGIVIDRRHPEEASVFAVLLNAKELARLRDQLKVALPDLIEESSADPAIVTQLADIGRVQGFSPIALADVSISKEALALRTRDSGGSDTEVQVPLVASTQKTVDRLPTAEQFRSAPLPVPSKAGSLTGPELGADQASADEVSRLASKSATNGEHAAGPIAGTDQRAARPGLGTPAAAEEKSDDMTLVFVWICKPRAS
jgi:hypothetical protein